MLFCTLACRFLIDYWPDIHIAGMVAPLFVGYMGVRLVLRVAGLLNKQKGEWGKVLSVSDGYFWRVADMGVSSLLDGENVVTLWWLQMECDRYVSPYKV